MAIVLSDIELRILGSLVEKEITVPEYYPLSLNALTAACSQKSNRHPIVSYDETTISEAIDGLVEKTLVIVIRSRDSRVTKYDNYFADFFHLSPAEAAAMCVLMLRGPQTVGEIKIRSERLHEFKSLEETQEALDRLAAREDGPLVVKLPRQAGHKEPRYAHVLGGEVDAANLSTESSAADDRILLLEDQVTSLQQELGELRDQFLDFKKQFD